MIKGKEGFDFNFYSYARLNVDVLISVTDTKNLSIVLQRRILLSQYPVKQKYKKILWRKKKWFKDYQSFSNLPQHKKWSFPLRISLVNVTKSAGKYVQSQLYEH